MRLFQVKNEQGEKKVCAVEGDSEEVNILDTSSSYNFFMESVQSKVPLLDLIERKVKFKINYDELLETHQYCAPIEHPDQAHFRITGTGLTHTGSALIRQKMHEEISKGNEINDSMKMFQMGLEGGKPKDGELGIQPEWFYKGDGSIVLDPGAVFNSPSFAMDAGDEPEIAGIYIIDDEGHPRRIGFAQGNEFSDHVMERINYLYLAHSKIRPCAIGPEILLGDLPEHIEGTNKILRDEKVIYESKFLSGEKNMSHSIDNLEYHHFKYNCFRKPGDIHCHFLGADTFSFSEGVVTEAGDVFEVSAKGFGRPLRNQLQKEREEKFTVRNL